MSNAFSHWLVWSCNFFSLLTWSTLLNFCILNQSCIPEINPTWCVILFMYFWILFANSLAMVFVYIHSWGASACKSLPFYFYFVVIIVFMLSPLTWEMFSVFFNVSLNFQIHGDFPYSSLLLVSSLFSLGTGIILCIISIFKKLLERKW